MKPDRSPMKHVDISRLGVRLAAAALAVGIAGWAIGSLVIRSSASDALRDEAEQVSLGAAERMASELDARIEGLTSSLALLAAQEDVSSLSPSAATSLAVAMRVVSPYDQLVLRDAGGDAVAATAADRLLRAGSVPPDTSVTEVVESGESVARVTSSGNVAIKIAVPVENPPGTVVGVLEGQVPLALTVQALQVRLFGDSARVIVAAPNGTLLSHPERSRVVEGERYPIDDLVDDDRVGTLDRDGTEVIAAVAAAGAFPGFVIVEEDESEALARVDEELGKLTILVALIVGATVFAVLVLGNRLVRPLAGLARTVRHIGAGEHSARADVTGSAEFQAVATEVNAMADALEGQINALEEAQRELRGAQERFRAAFEEAPVAMALTAPDETLVQVNAPMVQLLGRSADELASKALTELTHPDDRPVSQMALDRALRTGSRMYRTERRYLRSDGSTVPSLTNVAIMRDDDGEPEYLVVHAVDLSELRAAEARFRQIIESSPDVLLIASLDGTIEMINDRVSDVFGYAPHDVIGHAVEMLIPERFRESHVQHREGYAAEPRTREMGAGFELFGVRRDGSEFPVEVSLSPMEVDGQTKVIADVRDVTERRRGEQAARELREMHMRQRQAVEINDNIIQGLTIARWSFDLDQIAEARRAVERTIEAARALVDRMLETSGEIEPGSLTRERPAEFPR